MGLNPGLRIICSMTSYVICLVTQSYPTLCNPMDCSHSGSFVHGDSPGKNTEVGCHTLLQGIFPTQGSNPPLLHLLHWLVGSLPPAPPGKPIHGIAKSLQSCPTLCDPVDGNPPGSPVPGILQARTVEWVAMSFSIYMA